jgi:hypothetical protein
MNGAPGDKEVILSRFQMQRLQQLSLPLRVLVNVAAAAVILLALSAGVGATADLMFASDKGSPERAKAEQASMQEFPSDRQYQAEYLSKMGDLHSEAHQRRVDVHFGARSLRSTEIYTTQSVRAMIYHQLMVIVLTWIDRLALPQGSSILQVFRL